MKEVSTIFLDNLKEIGILLENRDFESAYKSISTITHFSNLAENPQGVFISEVLEGIFSQVGPILDNVQIPDEDINNMIAKLVVEYNKLTAAVSDKDDLGIYKSLVSIRYEATQFQLKWARIGKQKTVKKGVQIPPQVEEMMKKMLIR